MYILCCIDNILRKCSEKQKINKKLKTENDYGKINPTWSKFTYFGYEISIVRNIIRRENLKVVYAVKKRHTEEIDYEKGRLKI
jgi:hypothetical protein